MAGYEPRTMNKAISNLLKRVGNHLPGNCEVLWRVARGPSLSPAPFESAAFAAGTIPPQPAERFTMPEQAEEALQAGDLDMVLLGREFLGDPYWPYQAAKELGSVVSNSILPLQYARAVG